MFTIIIFAILGAAVGFVIGKNDAYCPMEFFGCVMGLLSGGMIGVTIAYILPMKTVVTQTMDGIEALQDGSSLKGSFFLGSGQIEGEMKYVMYLKSGDQFYMTSLRCKDVSIQYSDSAPALITFTKEPVKGELINKFAIDDDLGIIGYRVQVPKGTIKANYTLDAQ